MSKTESLLKRSWKNVFQENLRVNETCIKTLEIFIGQNKEMCYNKNWTKYVDDLEKLFESWKTRKLTIFGKVCVINSLAIPKVLYTGSILNLPNKYMLKKNTGSFI